MRSDWIKPRIYYMNGLLWVRYRGCGLVFQKGDVRDNTEHIKKFVVRITDDTLGNFRLTERQN